VHPEALDELLDVDSHVATVDGDLRLVYPDIVLGT
jgi:hypothetical protein